MIFRRVACPDMERRERKMKSVPPPGSERIENGISEKSEIPDGTPNGSDNGRKGIQIRQVPAGFPLPLFCCGRCHAVENEKRGCHAIHENEIADRIHEGGSVQDARDDWFAFRARKQIRRFENPEKGEGEVFVFQRDFEIHNLQRSYLSNIEHLYHPGYRIRIFGRNTSQNRK